MKYKSSVICLLTLYLSLCVTFSLWLLQEARSCKIGYNYTFCHRQISQPIQFSYINNGLGLDSEDDFEKLLEFNKPFFLISSISILTIILSDYGESHIAFEVLSRSPPYVLNYSYLRS